MRVFISYASVDVEAVAALAAALANEGIDVWRDSDRIGGGESYGPKIVEALKGADVILLCCSRNSVSNVNVKQEVQLAWSYRVPCLPLLLDGVKDFAHLEYWLAGIQYIDISAAPAGVWLPKVLAALRGSRAVEGTSADHGKQAILALGDLARFTDRIWPERYPTTPAPPPQGPVLRDLGATPGSASFAFRKGERVLLRIENLRRGHLLLLDQGTSGSIYCLSPSRFFPHPRVEAGVVTVPGNGAAYPYLEVSGPPGHERLIAIVTDEAPTLDLAPRQDRQAARLLDGSDCARLSEWLRGLPGDTWEAIATEFEILP